jgi:hypothetical protein
VKKFQELALIDPKTTFPSGTNIYGLYVYNGFLSENALKTAPIIRDDLMVVWQKNWEDVFSPLFWWLCQTSVTQHGQKEG